MQDAPSSPQTVEPRPAVSVPLDASLVVLFWVCAMALGYLGIVLLNDGFFTYTMDDPYIHLAIAEEISHGNYGVNAHEVCAACSSPIWPLFLTPFSAASFGHLVPFILNTLFGLATALLALGRVRRTFGTLTSGAGWEFFRAGLVIFFLLATNTIGLVFTGMEHNLQLLLAVIMVEGLLRMAEEQPPGRLFYLAVIAGPWVRYENLALTAAGLCMLFFSRRKWQACASGAGALGGLAAFSAFLMHLGLSPVPSSIKAKSTLIEGSLVESLMSNLSRSLTSDRGILLALGVSFLLAFTLMSRQSRGWKLAAGALAGAGILHLLCGAYGWWNRYEAYIFAAILWGMCGIGGVWFAAGRTSLKPSHGLALLPILPAIAFPYLYGLAFLPLAANNIYEQQYQMHRFVTEYWKKPVAVNDLGYVSYRNDQYVLDLWGLASHQALEARMNGENPEWMTKLAKEHDVKLAMIYAYSFPSLPQGWIKVGKLRLSGPRITPAYSEVALFAIGSENAAEIQSLLRQFRESLPKGVVLQTRDEEIPKKQ
jgi:hypothetical protein